MAGITEISENILVFWDTLFVKTSVVKIIFKSGQTMCPGSNRKIFIFCGKLLVVQIVKEILTVAGNCSTVSSVYLIPGAGCGHGAQHWRVMTHPHTTTLLWYYTLPCLPCWTYFTAGGNARGALGEFLKNIDFLLTQLGTIFKNVFCATWLVVSWKLFIASLSGGLISKEAIQATVLL